MKIVDRIVGLSRKRVSHYIIQKGAADIVYFSALGASTFLASRLLTPGDFGYFATFLIILNILIVVLDLGFRHATIKFISSEDNQAKKRQIARFANTTKLKLIIIPAIIAYPIILLLKSSIGQPFFLMFIYLPFISLLKSMILQFDSVLRARNLWIQSGFLLNLQPVTFILALLTVIAFGDFNLKACLAIYGLSNLLGFGAGYWMTYRHQAAEAGVNLKFFKKFITFGLPLTLNGALWTGADKIDKFVIFKYLPIQEIGSYNVAYFILRLIGQINSPIQSVLFTHFSSVDTKKGIRQIKKYFYFTLAVGFFLTFLLWGVSDLFFQLLYDSKYYLAPIYFRIMLLSVVFKLGSVPLSYFIIFIEGKTWKVAICQGAGFITNLVLSLVLIPQYGGIGAALAMVLTYALIFTGYALFVAGFNTGRQPQAVSLKMKLEELTHE